jgi:hypothetical protein
MGLGKFAKKVGRGAKKAAKKVGRGAKKASAVALDTTDTVLRGPGRALHDVPVLGRIADSIPSIRDPLAPVFEAVVATSLAKSDPINVPEEYTELVRRYATDVEQDRAWLARGLRAKPRFHHGGWVIKMQPAAGAMTMDNDVFVRRGRSLDVRLYVHELVHVGQYKTFGRTDFLTTYFGLSAATIAYRWVRRRPTEPTRSSPHEKSAYAIDKRFCTWLESQTTSGTTCPDTT